MSCPTERSPRPDGSEQRRGRGHYRGSRETSSQRPVTDNPAEPPNPTEPAQPADQDLRDCPSPPSFSRATTLIDQSPPRHPAHLNMSLSQHSLARPLEEASYSPAPTPPDSSQRSVSPDRQSTGAGSDSQRSLARPLEEATYPQYSSPPLSEPASSQPPSTQSSGPYMPRAFLRYRRAVSLVDFNHVTFQNRPLSPIGRCLEEPLDVLQAPRSEGTASVHSLAHPVEERCSWGAIPPLSLLIEPGDEMITNSSQHSLARPLEELYFAEDMHTDPPHRTWSAEWTATTRSQADQAVNDRVHQLHTHGPLSPTSRPVLTRQRLEAMRTCRCGRRSLDAHDNTVVEPQASLTTDTAHSSAPTSSGHCAVCNPAVFPDLSSQQNSPQPLSDAVLYSRFDHTEPGPSSLSLSAAAERTAQVAEAYERLLRDPHATLHRRRRPTGRDEALNRQQVELTAKLGNDPPDGEDSVGVGEPEPEEQGVPPVDHDTDRTHGDQPQQLWQHIDNSKSEEQRINRWLELTEPPKKRG